MNTYIEPNLTGLSVEQMAEIMLMKSKASEALGLLSEQRDKETQAQVSALANFAQLGLWPEGRKISRRNWLPGARKKAVDCWRIETDGTLAVTENGTLGRIREGGLGHIISLNVSFWVLLSGAVLWFSNGEMDILNRIGMVVPGMMVGGMMGLLLCFPLVALLDWAERRGFIRQVVFGVDPVALSSLSEQDREVLKAGQESVKVKALSWQKAIEEATKIDPQNQNLLLVGQDNDKNWLKDPLNAPVTGWLSNSMASGGGS